MEEHEGAVTWGDKPLTIIGSRLKVGEKAPDFTVLDNSFRPVKFSDSSGKVRLISVVPSLETSICDAQTRRFNEEAASLDPDIEIITISADHPITQKRWCGAAGIDRVHVYSDHLEMDFGHAYGTWIKERRLEQRAIFVVDRDDVLTYIEYLPKIGMHPDYEQALDALRSTAEGD